MKLLTIFFYKTNSNAYPGSGEGDIEACHLPRGLHLEMTTHGIFVPSGRKFSHSCTCPFITLPEPHQHPLVMSANCVSLSCLGAPLALHASTLSSPGAVAMASRSHQNGCGIRSSQNNLLFQWASILLLPGVHVTTRPSYSHGYMPGLAFTSKVPPNS